ncbi:MAG: AAA family ATPase [Dehalococcoidia bacterium]
MPTITITGLLGARAREVGMMAADMLGIDYVDQAILVDAARRLGVPVNVMAERDERAATLGQRLASVLRNFLERSAAAGAGDPLMGSSGLEVLLARTYGEMTGESGATPEIDEARYIETIASILTELGRRGNIVVIGRGSQVLLREMPEVLHCLCIASMKDRVRWVMEREQLAEPAALARAKEHEKHWSAFHRRFFKVDVYDPHLYDLVINSSRLPFETAVKLVATAAHHKEELYRTPGQGGAARP